MAPLAFRPIDITEFPEFHRTLEETFGEDPRTADREQFQRVFEPKRSLAGFDGDRIISTAGFFSREMTLPGGPRPIAAVSLVSVTPTHRRRGVLTEMMRRQLVELYEGQQEPVAALWASEGGIYGRFGYGSAAPRLVLTGRTADMRLRPGTDLGTGRVRLAGSEEARPYLAAVYDQARSDQVGWLDRRDGWWAERLYDPEHARTGSTALRFALYEEADGQVTGYAAYRIKQVWQEGWHNNSEVQVVELTATTPPAYAAIWSFLVNLDLTPVIRKWCAPMDEPLQHLLVDPRGLRGDVLDSLWIRLVDLRRALTERTYPVDVDVVLDVTDDFCPWNAGRWRLAAGPGGATCAPASAPADLALTSTDLGTAYLGGITLSSLAASGRVRELRAGALAASQRAFATDRAPWCPEVF